MQWFSFKKKRKSHRHTIHLVCVIFLFVCGLHIFPLLISCFVLFHFTGFLQFIRCSTFRFLFSFAVSCLLINSSLLLFFLLPAIGARSSHSFSSYYVNRVDYNCTWNCLSYLLRECSFCFAFLSFRCCCFFFGVLVYEIGSGAVEWCAEIQFQELFSKETPIET